MNKEINEFKGKNFFLSNYYNCEFEFDGIKYTSSEAAFQAQKTLDINERYKVSKMSPAESKKYCGRRGTLKLRADWEEVKDNVMYEVIKAKFSQNKYIADKLLSTGDATLIEGTTWHDNYWGNCTCCKCNNITGKNMLGKLLMRLREEIRHNK